MGFGKDDWTYCKVYNGERRRKLGKPSGDRLWAGRGGVGWVAGRQAMTQRPLVTIEDVPCLRTSSSRKD
jgi:hypothetical protein